MPCSRINDVDLFHFTVGEGPPCLVMHGGLGSDHTYLHPWLDPLADSLSLVYYDHRGNGRSDDPDPETITWENLCSDAEGLRNHLGLGPAVVLGHSFGGYIALEYALRHPASVSRLVLVSTAAAPEDMDEVIRNIEDRDPALLEIVNRPRPTTDDELRQVAADLGPLFFHRFDPELSARMYQHTRWRVSANRNEELMQGWDLRSRLPEIKVPTLILAGRHDPAWGPRPAEAMRRRIPNADLVIFEDSAHVPYVEEPELFFAVIRNWIRETAPDREPSASGT